MKKPILIIKFGGQMSDYAWAEFNNMNKDALKKIRGECDVVLLDRADCSGVEFFYVEDDND